MSLGKLLYTKIWVSLLFQYRIEINVLHSILIPEFIAYSKSILFIAFDGSLVFEAR